MRTLLLFVAASCVLAANPVHAEESRQIRHAGDGISKPVDPPRIQDADWGTELGYMVEEDYAPFWTIPNFDSTFNDKYFNVRFSPDEGGYFRLLRVIIPLYGIPVDDEFTVGTPGIKLYFWRSDSLYRDSGYPVEEITTIDVDHQGLEFSGDEVDTWFMNVIDIEDEFISFGDSVDFHIGVDVISDDVGDTLALFSDLEDDHDRSLLWDGNEEVWKKTGEVPLEDSHGNRFYTKFNYGIWCVITHDLDVDNPREIVLGPTLPTNIIAFDPAWPNPFNHSVKVNFSVRDGVPYHADIHDLAGRKIKNISRGIGSGQTSILITGDGLPNGSYYLRLFAEGEIQSQILYHMK